MTDHEIRKLKLDLAAQITEGASTDEIEEWLDAAGAGAFELVEVIRLYLAESTPATMDKVVAMAVKLRRAGRTHSDACRIVADAFDLWDADDRFPVWLSRVIDGACRDDANGE